MQLRLSYIDGDFVNVRSDCNATQSHSLKQGRADTAKWIVNRIAWTTEKLNQMRRYLRNECSGIPMEAMKSVVRQCTFEVPIDSTELAKYSDVTRHGC